MGGKVLYAGYTIDVLNEMAKRLNFTYILFEPADKFYGNLRDDGTWTGIMGEMVRGVNIQSIFIILYLCVLILLNFDKLPILLRHYYIILCFISYFMMSFIILI